MGTIQETNKKLANKQDVCNLDCEKKKPVEKKDQPKKKKKIPIIKEEAKCNINVFKGPVRLVLMEGSTDRGSNCKRIAAGLIAMANIAIGANFAIFLIFSMGYIFRLEINFHVFLCHFACQLFLPLSILMHHPLYGAAGPLSSWQRTWAHVKILILAAFYIAGGVYLGYRDTLKPKTLIKEFVENALELHILKMHVFSGYAIIGSFVLSLTNGIILILARLCESQKFKTVCLYFHTITGMITVATSNICYILMLFTPTLQILIYNTSTFAPTFTMVFLVVFYTVILAVLRGSNFSD